MPAQPLNVLASLAAIASRPNGLATLRSTRVATVREDHRPAVRRRADRRCTATPSAAQTAHSPDFAVGPQYDTTHAYVPPECYDAFMASLIATFGGKLSPQGQFQVTPTPSKTKSQLALTPAGTVSGFGFLTPIPYPFGHERTGYLVTDLDAAVAAALRHGAVRLIASFPDPIGRDVVVQWPGGVNMQLYWHTTKPNYAPLATIPENRVYLSPDVADAFLKSWSGYAHARVIEDTKAADAAEIGEPGKTYRRVRLTSGYGDMLVIVSDGQLPWPYGHDVTGYTVTDLRDTLAKATAAGVETLVPAHAVGDRQSAMVRFAYNSCRNRHCPRCQGAAARTWLAEREADVLPVGYFHVVFTLPAEVADIALQNKSVVYGLLFQAASETMTTIAADPKHLGARLGITAVLHTWGSAMTHHPHIHMIVPGGGLSRDGSCWISSRPAFLLPVRVLGKLFRRLFLTRLMALHETGRLDVWSRRLMVRV